MNLTVVLVFQICSLLLTHHLYCMKKIVKILIYQTLSKQYEPESYLPQQNPRRNVSLDPITGHKFRPSQRKRYGLIDPIPHRCEIARYFTCL